MEFYNSGLERNFVLHFQKVHQRRSDSKSESAKLCALHCLVPYVSRSLLVLILHEPSPLCPPLPQMPRSLSVPLPHVPGALRALVPYVLSCLRCFLLCALLLLVFRASCALHSMCSRTTYALLSYVPLILRTLRLSCATIILSALVFS